MGENSLESFSNLMKDLANKYEAKQEEECQQLNEAKAHIITTYINVDNEQLLYMWLEWIKPVSNHRLLETRAEIAQALHNEILRRMKVGARSKA